MHRDLLTIIQRFRSDQDRSVAVLRNRLGIVPPQSNIEWAKALQEIDGPLNAQAIHDRGLAHGLFVRPHGFGIEVGLDGGTIDFDWGDRGESYGFDLSRIWVHCRFNRLFEDLVTEKLLTSYFRHAIHTGQFERDHHLFYLPSERAERYHGPSLPPPTDGELPPVLRLVQ